MCDAIADLISRRPGCLRRPMARVPIVYQRNQGARGKPAETFEIAEHRSVLVPLTPSCSSERRSAPFRINQKRYVEIALRSSCAARAGIDKQGGLYWQKPIVKSATAFGGLPVDRCRILRFRGHGPLAAGQVFARPLQRDSSGVSSSGSVGLVRAFGRYANVVGLLRGELGQLHADLLQVQPGHFFVELLRQACRRSIVGVLVLPQIELRQRLVGEAVDMTKLG